MAVSFDDVVDARSVAIIGASADPTKIGGRPIAYLQQTGFAGRIVPVNPMRKEVQGLDCVPDIRDAGQVDLAILATPADGVREAVRTALEAGTRALVLFTAGYGETGAEGHERQQALAQAATAAGAAMLGPNCLGAINFHSGLTATFTTALESAIPRAGGLSYLGQSGALGAYWIEMAAKAGLGLGKWITTGNEAQLGAADALKYLARDQNTTLICAYLEEVRDKDAFAAAAAAAQDAGKAILVLKSGRSARGAEAAAAHTGSSTGSDDWYEGFFAELGISRVRSLTQMINAARLLSAPRPVATRNRLGIVTVSGGAGVLICDAAEQLEIEIAQFDAQLSSTLAAILPGYASPRNPVDITGAVVSDKQLMERALVALADSGACDAILVFIGSMRGIAENLSGAIRTAMDHGCPIAVVWMAADEKTVAGIEAIGIPVFNDIPPALEALSSAAFSSPDARQSARHGITVRSAAKEQ